MSDIHVCLKVEEILMLVMLRMSHEFIEYRRVSYPDTPLSIFIPEIVYYESIKRELKIKPIYECRCDERLQTKTKRFTRLSYTGSVVELEHLKIKTR